MKDYRYRFSKTTDYSENNLVWIKESNAIMVESLEGKRIGSYTIAQDGKDTIIIEMDGEEYVMCRIPLDSSIMNLKFDSKGRSDFLEGYNRRAQLYFEKLAPELIVADSSVYNLKIEEEPIE